MHRDIKPAYHPRRRIGGLGLIRNESDEVLLVKPSYRDGWQPPGGHAHADEMPHVACRREVHQETQLNLRPGPLLAIDYTPRSQRSPEGYNYVYAYPTVPNDVRITLPPPEPGEEPELTDWRFVPFTDLGYFAHRDQEARIRAAAAVADVGTGAVYLMQGRPIALTT